MSNSNLPDKPLTKAEIDAQMARLDGINGAAGHEITDPYIRDLLRKQIAGEISAEDVQRLGMAHLNSKVYDDE